MKTKEVIAQDIMLHETVLQYSTSMTHFTEGLKEVGILDLIMEFLNVFEPLFTACSVINAKSVKNILSYPDFKILTDLECAAINNVIMFI